MNSASNNSSVSYITFDNSFTPKLRRLKIQEGVLSANVDKCISRNLEDNDGCIQHDKNVQLKKYFCKLKDSCKDIKNLLEEITVRTSVQESFEKSDIDELKKYILELETKIKISKQFVTDELQALREQENMLCDMEHGQINEEIMVTNIKTNHSKGLKEIVPSPVRMMIKSPFKCLEVQQFQDFMKNSPNRYGGWNEYEHNIFVQIWKKYYEPNLMYDFQSIKDKQDFMEDVLHKITGKNTNDVDTHIKWYLEFLHFKVNQRMALNMWKENKRKIKATRNIKTKQIQMEESTIDDIIDPVNSRLDKKRICAKYKDGNMSEILYDTFTAKNEESINNNQSNRCVISNSSLDNDYKQKQKTNKKFDVSRLTRPTKQWINMRDSVKDTYEFNGCIENINKLRIPAWRSILNK